MNLNFLLLWQGQAVSQIGSQISVIATLFWLKHATESPALIGTISMIAGLAAVALGPVGGAFADRYSRRSIIIVCDLVSGLTVISLAFTLFFAPEARGWTLVWVGVVSITLSVVNSFFMPAIAAATPDLVPKEKIAAANSMLQASLQITGLLGQGIGGMLFRLLGAPLVLVIDGITYLLAAFSGYFIKIPQELAEKSGDWRERIREFMREMWEGVSYIRTNTGLTQLLLVSTFLNFFTAPILGLFAFYVEDHLKLHPDWFGYLLTVYGIGNLVGYLLAGTIQVPSRIRAGLILAAMFSQSVLCGSLGVARMSVMVAAIILGIGALSGFVNISVSTILQLTTPSEIRGRVFGLLATISACLLPIGMGLGGTVASLLGKQIPLIYVFCGVCMTLITLVASVLSRLRRYLATDPEVAPAVISLDPEIKEAAGAD